MAMAATLELNARDVSGQRRFRLTGVPSGASVSEMMRTALNRMGLVRDNTAGEALQYGARLEREGRQLHGSERIGDVLENGDEILLTPRISAG